MARKKMNIYPYAWKEVQPKKNFNRSKERNKRKRED
jgi:hypothetical protein